MRDTLHLTSSKILVLVLLNKICVGQVIQFGTCANVETMKYFQLEKFLGKWYEIERFPTWYEDYGQCAYKTIQYCGKIIDIEHGFVRDDIRYILHVNSTYSAGDDAVFVMQENNIDPIGIPMAVVSTDYNNYAIIYGCKDSPILGIQYSLAWILSRNKTMSSEAQEKTYDILNKIPYASTAYLEPVVQNEENCQYNWSAHVNATLKENGDQ